MPNISVHNYGSTNYYSSFAKNHVNSKSFGSKAARNIDPRIFAQKHHMMIDKGLY